MSKVTDMILSAILRKGILYEAKNCNMEFEVPIEQLIEGGENTKTNMRIVFKADNMTLRMEKGRSQEE
jgi:hypothetical protein